jgi:hypothetical protein
VADESWSVSRSVRRERGIWQRHFYEHIIRDERDVHHFFIVRDPICPLTYTDAAEYLKSSPHLFHMANYSALSIHNGYGNVHINRFRICVKPTLDAARIATIGGGLIQHMPTYMAKNTASVQVGDHSWNSYDTLKFRGVARIRPFSVPITVPVLGIPIQIPVPKQIRDWMMPDIHTDSVGAVVQHATGFTVQTLKREFEDGDDKAIRKAIALLAASAAIVPVAAVSIPMIVTALGNIAVYYNQHHFLAGRRGFRFDVGSSFGYGDGRLVFETSAIERFSSVVFAGSQLAMGSIPKLVQEVWGQMLERFCATHGLVPITGEQPQPGWTLWGGKVHCLQTEVAPSVDEIRSHPHFSYINAEHKQILEPRP